MNSPPMASVAAADRVIDRIPESRLGLRGHRLGGEEALRRTSRWVIALVINRLSVLVSGFRMVSVSSIQR